MGRRSRIRTNSRGALVVLALLAIGLLGGGVSLYLAQERHTASQVQDELEAIAALKTNQIADWRHERLADAAVLAGSAFLVQGVHQWFETPNADLADEIVAHLLSVQQRYRYHDLMLLDASGQVRLSLKENMNAGTADAELVAAVLHDQVLRLSDLHVDALNGDIHISVAAPLNVHEEGQRRSIGAVLLVSNADQFLYPLIQSWPIRSQTAETLLVRRDGDHVLFLNNLRHREDMALKLRIPLTQTDLPAVKATQGQQGVVSGIDYRGVPVLSVLRAIPDSPWFMVSKVDKAEVFSAWRARSLLLFLLFVALLGLLVFAGVSLVQRDRRAHFQALYLSEAARRAVEERHGVTLLGIGDAVIATDAQGRVELLNPVAEALTGWTCDEALGQPVEKVFHIVNEHTQAVVESPVAKVLEVGAVVGLANHTLLISKDGTRRPIADSGAPIRGASGEITGVVLVFRDQSEARDADQAKEKLQAQLAQAHKLESVGRLAGGVAHDFNNMLAVILGRTEIALERVELSQPVRNDLLEIQTAAERSASLTRQLLAFARKQTVAPKILDLNDTVSGMLLMLRRLIGEDIELAWQPGVKLGKVEVDPTQIDQILANLAINARDALRNGGKITIETQNATLDDDYAQSHIGVVPGDYVMLAFSDNGSGMERSVVEHLFEPFFTTKGLGQGTGLGLATVYGIVQQNRGGINVYSEPGQGTTFKIYLPQCSAPARELIVRAGSVPCGSGELVLLVEDEVPILELGKAMLERLGYTVVSAALPDQALSLAEQHAGQLALLITDVVMPKMNGRQLAESLSAKNPGLKCLFMSGYTADVIAHHGVLEDGVAFLHKPFSMRELGNSVHKVLTARAGNS